MLFHSIFRWSLSTPFTKDTPIKQINKHYFLPLPHIVIKWIFSLVVLPPHVHTHIHRKLTGSLHPELLETKALRESNAIVYEQSVHCSSTLPFKFQHPLKGKQGPPHPDRFWSSKLNVPFELKTDHTAMETHYTHTHRETHTCPNNAQHIRITPTHYPSSFYNSIEFCFSRLKSQTQTHTDWPADSHLLRNSHPAVEMLF